MTIASEQTTSTSVCDFSLTSDQKVVREAARDFARQEIDPLVDELDESQVFPLELFAKLGELGFLGVIFPEEYGGSGLGYVEYVLVITEISRVDPSIGLSVAAHNSLCSNHIYKFGNEEQTTALARASGQRQEDRGMEPHRAGCRLRRRRNRTRAEEGRGWLDPQRLQDLHHPRIGGRHLCGHGGDGSRGSSPSHLSAFVLEKGMEGFRPGKKENKLGTRASDTSEVIMEDCFVPDEHLLGERGEGFMQAVKILDGGRISIAALGLGTAIGAYETALAYAKERVQFGKPIAEFQAIQFHLAEMATRIAAAEALTMAAALKMDQGKRVTRLAAEAKLYTGETAVFCAERGVQIHGGYGYIKDYRAEKFYRDCKICTIGEGTSEIQRLVIARQLLRERR